MHLGILGQFCGVTTTMDQAQLLTDIAGLLFLDYQHFIALQLGVWFTAKIVM